MALLAGLCATVAICGAPLGMLRTPAGLLLVLVLPGYALATALFPGGLGWPERLALSLGLSLACGALLGIVLHVTPWGLRPVPLGLALTALAIGGSIAAALRRRGHARSGPPLRRGGPNGVQGLLLGLAAGVLVGAAGLTAWSASQPAAEGFTQLWVRPAETPEGQRVSIGFSSQEREPITFRLLVTHGGTVLLDLPEVRCAPGQEAEAIVELPPTAAVGEVVEVRLYRADAPEVVYRRVTWRVPPAEGPRTNRAGPWATRLLGLVPSRGVECPAFASVRPNHALAQAGPQMGFL